MDAADPIVAGEATQCHGRQRVHGRIFCSLQVSAKLVPVSAWAGQGLGRGSARPVAAFIVEPIRGKAANIPANRYLKSAADLCLRFGTLFIADEVQTSKGRTGRFLAVEHWGVEPDIVLLAKTFWRTRASPSRSGPQEYI